MISLRDSRRKLSEYAAAAAATCLLAMGPLAQAAPSSPTRIASDNAFIPAEALEAMRRQEPLARAAHVLREAIETSGLKGLAGVAFDNGEVVLRWKGAIPLSLQKAIGEASKSASVRVEAATFTFAELKEEAHRFAHLVRSKSRPSAPLQGVLITNQGTIQLEPMPDADVLSIQMALPSARFPVQVVPSSRSPVALAASRPLDATDVHPTVTWWRGDDSPPWSGGAHINSYRGTQHRFTCTSGFGVRKGSYNYVLTAAHCGTAPDIFRDGPPNEDIGSVSYEDWRLDLLLIYPPRGAIGNIYWGTPGTNITKNVGGWDWVWSTDWLCASGMYTGTKCGLRPTGNWAAHFQITDSDGDTFEVVDMVELYDYYNECPATQGDSGGPVVTLIDSGTRVLAKGILVAKDLNDCRRIWIQDFGTAVNRFAITPLVGG